MKKQLIQLVKSAIGQAHQAGDLPSPDLPKDWVVEVPKNEVHGDFSTNVAMAMAAIQKMPPRKIAEAIISRLQGSAGMLAKTEIAGPGFINFFLNATSWHAVLERVHRADKRYGEASIGQNKKIQVEFVSSNPTGPLHVGHGRGAAVGDSVANILRSCGYDVQKEYYINDSGRQIETLGLSVFLRYKESLGNTVEFPETCYQGSYITAIAEQVKARKGDSLLNKEESEAIQYCAQLAAQRIMDEIREDLDAFGVTFDVWFSEQSLYDSGMVAAVIQAFQDRQIIYAKDGAQWFKTTAFGDEKDRVVVRQNGQTTYFASDIAYHQEKFQRGFERVIDVWGADHHGYIARMKASIEASGRNPEQFQVILVQLVNLLRGGEPVAMSTRAGEFVTLQDVVAEVGKDAARFIFLSRHYDSPLDFDLEVAKQKSNDNPVYYVQYVHARIASIVRKAHNEGIDRTDWDAKAAARLLEPEEIRLLKQLARYPEVVLDSAEYLEPHRITFYLMNLAALFHSYYNKHRVLAEDPVLAHGRLALVLGIQKVIRNGLTLLGVSAPDRM
jgi:arginyl-tRNA synthetase